MTMDLRCSLIIWSRSPTSRQSQRPQPSRSVQSHRSRRLRSWLTFNVGQNITVSADAKREREKSERRRAIRFFGASLQRSVGDFAAIERASVASRKRYTAFEAARLRASGFICRERTHAQRKWICDIRGSFDAGAQPVARANDHSRHDLCRATDRARCGRGSSLTLAKELTRRYGSVSSTG